MEPRKGTELAIATLACARIGAIHSVVFAGFSARSLEDRINDATCNIVVTGDGAYRGAKTIDLKGIVDKALETCPSIEKCIVQKRWTAKTCFLCSILPVLLASQKA